eukprot:snap_masked-scaffold_6-processed-gene-1.13-mRNA-1 protein AED:1.00 eAED:1.00 QI:0/0/0/0/1/1/3/0/61
MMHAYSVKRNLIQNSQLHFLVLCSDNLKICELLGNNLGPKNRSYCIGAIALNSSIIIDFGL